MTYCRRTVGAMSNPNGPSGGFAPEDMDAPGEFNAGPGFMARELGIPAGLDSRYTDAQRTAQTRVPALPVSPARQAMALRATDPTDESATPNPYTLGS